MFNAYLRVGCSHMDTATSSASFLQQTDLCKMVSEQTEGCSLNLQRRWHFTPKISDTLNSMNSVDTCASIYNTQVFPRFTGHTLTLMHKHNPDHSR